MDVWAFREALDQGDVDRALSLYRGDFLAGFQVGDAPRFVRWADDQRERFRDRAHEAALTAGRAAREAGTLEDATAGYERALELRPLRESAAIELVRTLAEGGRTAEALQRYETFRKRRDEELDLPPSEEFEALIERIRAGEVERRASPPADEDVSDPEAATGAGQEKDDEAPPRVPPEAGAQGPDRHQTPGPEGPGEGFGHVQKGLAAIVLTGAVAAGWYLLGSGGEPPPEVADRPASTARDTVGPPRIAVLPFENIAPDSADDYFAQGMHEEVLNQLSKVSGLEVISRTSVMGYADTDKRVPEISRELDVDAILEGTVRRAGDRVRITTQLIETPADEPLWSNTYERALSVEEIFDIQADIAGQIVGALETELAGGERERIEDAPTSDLAAYEAFLRGRSRYFEHWSTWRPADLRRSVEAFREAIQLDTAFAEAHAWLGLAYIRGMRWGGVEGGVDSTSVAVERTRAIEPQLAAVHLAQAQIYEERDSTSAAIASLRRALELQPSHAYAKARLSDALADDGQHVEAVSMAWEAVQLAPRQPAVLQEMSDQLNAVGFYDAAAAWHRYILEIEPGHVEAIVGLSSSQLLAGHPDDALETRQRYLETTDAPFPGALEAAASIALRAGHPDQAKAYLERIPEARRERRPDRAEVPSEPGLDDPFIRALLGLAEFRLGNGERGRALLQQAADSVRASMEEDTEDSARTLYILAQTQAALGQPDRALENLERWWGMAPHRPDWISFSPFFDDLRSDPRFQEIVREIEAEQQKLREEIRQLGIDLYPPGAKPDTARRPNNDGASR